MLDQETVHTKTSNQISAASLFKQQNKANKPTKNWRELSKHNNKRYMNLKHTRS